MHRVDFVLMIDLVISCLKNPFLANLVLCAEEFCHGLYRERQNKFTC